MERVLVQLIGTYDKFMKVRKTFHNLTNAHYGDVIPRREILDNGNYVAHLEIQQLKEPVELGCTTKVHTNAEADVDKPNVNSQVPGVNTRNQDIAKSKKEMQLLEMDINFTIEFYLVKSELITTKDHYNSAMKAVEKVQGITHTSERTPKAHNLWDEWWIVVLIVSVLAIEWILRKAVRLV